MTTLLEQTSLLEQTLPAYHLHERHSRLISADPDMVWNVLSTLTLDQLVLTRPLVAIRFLGSHLAKPAKPLFVDGPVRMLEILPPNYAVGGAVARPWQLHAEHREINSLEELARFSEPGWVRSALDSRCPMSRTCGASPTHA